MRYFVISQKNGNPSNDLTETNDFGGLTGRISLDWVYINTVGVCGFIHLSQDKSGGIFDIVMSETSILTAVST